MAARPSLELDHILKPTLAPSVATPTVSQPSTQNRMLKLLRGTRERRISVRAIITFGLATAAVGRIVSATAQHTIYVCGYNFSVLAEAVFPEFQIHTWSAESVSKPYDIMLASGPHCRHVSRFSGRVLYVDGESGEVPEHIQKHPRIYYLGCCAPPAFRGPTVSMYHIAHTTLFHDYDAQDFLRPRSGPVGQHFLAYINSHCVGFREDSMDTIAKLAREKGYARPHALGKCHGKEPYTEWLYAGDKTDRIKNVAVKLRSYRFALVMENSYTKGYITEKIANAFISGSIPIYFGTTDIFHIFNRNAFIYYDINDPAMALKRISSLEENPELYNEMRAQPILANGKQTISDFFSLRVDIGDGELRNTIRSLVLKY